MIASAIKVNVATVMPSENVTKLELYPSVTHITVCTSISFVKAVFQNTIVKLCLRPLSDYLTAIRTGIRPLALFSSAMGFCHLQ